MTWDVVIVGGGPAAIQAAISGASEGLKVLIIEKDKVGGQIGQTPLLENFVAAQGGITGPQFAESMKAQAQRMGVNFAENIIVALSRVNGSFVVHGGDGEIYDAHTVVVATGNRWQDIDIPGIKKGIQAGRVHYGPVNCLSAQVNGQDVAVYGGGPSAGQAILALSQKAKTVHVLMRSTLRMPQYLVDRIHALENAKLYEYTTIMAIHLPSGGVGIDIANMQNGYYPLPPILVNDLFMCSGLLPNTEWLPDEIQKDENGRVLVGAAVDNGSFLGTSMPGVFAIGDCRHGSTARVSAAIGDGAFVITELWKYFRQHPVCSVCTPKDFTRVAGEYTGYKAGQMVRYLPASGLFRIMEVLNAQQVRLAGVAGIIDMRDIQPVKNASVA